MVQQLQNLKDNQTVAFQLQKLISELVNSVFELQVEPDFVEVTSTQEAKFGDFTSNVSLKLSKQLGKNPREIGDLLASKLADEKIEKVEVAGPGFLNIYLKPSFYTDQLKEILESNKSFGSWNLDNSQVMIEFGQPNTHKAFHVGHLKSAISGLALSRLVRNLGYEVIQANFFGDIGMHVAKCVWGFIQKGKPEGFEDLDPHTRMRYIDQCYVYGAKFFKEDPAAEAEIKEINKKIYNKTDEKINQVYQQTRAWTIEHQDETFKALGVVYDRQFPESEIDKDAVEIVKKHIGDIFIEDQKAIIFPGEKYHLNRWVFLTGEGLPTYEAKDLGLAYKKFQVYPKLAFSIITTSVEQVDHFKAVIKILELIDSKFVGRYMHVPFGWMLRSDGKKFSSRMGETVKGIDILNEAREYSLAKISELKKYNETESAHIAEKVAVAGLKFLILSHEFHKDFSYDPEQFTNPEGFSGPYILYGYVRAKSILKQAGSFNAEALKLGELNEVELSLLKLLTKYPTVTFDSGKTLSPHKLCNYLFELTQLFNQFYRENKVLVDDEQIKNTRLALTNAVAIVLGNGLDLLGIETIEQM